MWGLMVFYTGLASLSSALVADFLRIHKLLFSMYLKRPLFHIIYMIL